jgi:hypothetical protein
MDYQKKYLKYKSKYLITKNNKTLKMHGGMNLSLKTVNDVLQLEQLTEIKKKEFDALKDELKLYFFKYDEKYYKRLTIDDINKLKYLQIITKEAFENINGSNIVELQGMFMPYNYKCDDALYNYEKYLKFTPKDLCIPNEYIKKISIDDLDKLEPLYKVPVEKYAILEPRVQDKFIYINETDLFEALYRQQNRQKVFKPLDSKYLISFYRKKLRSEDIAKLKPLTLLYKTEYDLLDENDKTEFRSIAELFILYGKYPSKKSRFETITFYRKKLKIEEVSTLIPWTTLYSSEFDRLPDDKKQLIKERNSKYSIKLTSENISKFPLFGTIDSEKYEELDETEQSFFKEISDSEYMCNRQPIDDAELSDEIYREQWDILNEVWKDKYDKKDRKYIKKSTKKSPTNYFKNFTQSLGFK